MDKKTFRKAFKNMLKNKNITELQEEYLKNLYADEDYIVGIHKTFAYESIFENGLYNYTDSGDLSKDLSNTVMYSDVLPTLMSYCSGAQKNNDRYSTSIILKIPKKVFEKEQGIFENLKGDMHGIPSEFIACAFENGEIIQNPLYNKEYYSDKAQVCDDNIKFENKNEYISLYNEYNKGNIFKQIINKIKNITNKNQTKLFLESTNNHENEFDIKDELSIKVNNEIEIKDISIQTMSRESMEKDVEIEFLE